MIDIHCHILPLVDDGPTSYDEAIQMVDMAYTEGTRCIIATPHRNHPFEFTASEPIETTYQKLREMIQSKYNDFGIVLGAELYITKDYLTLLETRPYDFTINDTSYILIEFDREIKHKEMLNVVHEIIIRGYKPIIAHVEMYPHLKGDIEKVRSIRNEGAYIQITGSSITGKHGIEMSIFLRKLIRLGLVDFVASDGHKIDARRPSLQDAYRTIAGILSEKDADRIFKHNPKALIAGKHITQPTYAIKSSGSKVVRVNSVAASVAVLLIAVGTLFSLLGRDDALTTEVDSYAIEAAIANESVAAGETNGDVTAGEAVKEVVPQTIASSETLSNIETITKQSITTNGASTIPSKEAIENEYFESMKTLESHYVSQLEAIVANIKIAKENISDDEQRKTIIEAYVDEIVTLEEQSDNSVYELLYKMQNTLEKYKYDVEKVHEMRGAYHQIKENKQSEYVKALGY